MPQEEDGPVLDLPEPPSEPPPLPAQAPSAPQRAVGLEGAGNGKPRRAFDVRQSVPGDTRPAAEGRQPLPRTPLPPESRLRTPPPPESRQPRSLGRTPMPPSSAHTELRPPPSSSAAAQSGPLSESDLDDDDHLRSSYSLRARDLPLSVARRSSQLPRDARSAAQRAGIDGTSRGQRAEETSDKPPRPPARPAPEGALPIARPPGPAISPRMTAIFGGLFGLAAITSVVAVLIQAAPPKNDRLVMAHSATAAAAAAAPSAEPANRSKKPKREALPGPWRIKEMEKDPAITLVSGVMGKVSFLTALEEKKVPKAQAFRVLKAFEPVRKFDRTGRKDRFTVAMEKGSQRIKAFEYEVSPTEIYQAREDAQGLLVGTKLDMKIAENEFAGAFYVQKDVTKSYEEGGFEPGILAALDQALVGRMSSDSFDEGGTVRAIVLEETALGLFARYKRVLALEYRPPGDARPLRIYYFPNGQSKGYWDDKGRQMYGGGFQKPVPGAYVTSKFNPKRVHPILKRIMPHQGTDFGAPSGTPIYASYKGTVQFVGNGGATGNFVSILHANGVETGYAHMSRFAPGIKIGDKVATKQLIGYVGTTGRSTGPHLHFSAKKNGQFFDAETLLALDKERVLPPEDRAAFLELKTEMDKRLDAIPLPEPPKPPAPVAAASAPASPHASRDPDGDDDPAPAASSAPAAKGAKPVGPGGAIPGFVEDDGDDDEGGELIPGALLGGAPASPNPSSPSGSGKPPGKQDPPEEEDE